MVLLNTMKKSKATGREGISNRIFIHKNLAGIFKSTQVIPIFKSGGRNESSNYRPTYRDYLL